jgi:hypothetical protein
MGSLPFAFSVHHFISSVGADAGFASIIGLAILVLLYFAQARETATLRDHAYEAANRIQQLEARLAQQARGVAPTQQARAQAAGDGPGQAPGQASAAQPAPGLPAVAPAPSTAAGAGESAPAIAAAPVAPAGVAAPALSAATRLIPTAAPAAAMALAPQRSAQNSELEPEAQPVAGSTTTAEPARRASESAPTPREPEPEPAPAQREPERVAGPPPATVAGAANGSDREGVAPRPVSAPVPTATPPPRVQPRPGTAGAPRRPVQPPPRSRPPQDGSSGGLPRVWLGVLAVLGVAAIIVLLLLITSGGGSSPSSSTTASTNSPSPRRSGKTAVNPSSVTVAVLNGTATNGLARRVAGKLSGVGYKQGTVATASDQTRTATIIAYLPGFRRDALAVATSLKTGAASVQPIDQSTQAVACPPPAGCSANVVVTVGSDLANTQ